MIYHLASIREIEVIIGCVVILSHSPASDNNPEDKRQPGNPNNLSVETVDDQSIPNILLRSSMHKPEVEQLVAW